MTERLVMLMQYGWNALHYACTKGSFELSRLLVQNGADFSAINKVCDSASVIRTV